MLKTYLKIAGRRLWHHKRYVLVNLAGLGVALGMCILAYLSWKFDRDFDRFHTNGNHIFRVITTKKSNQLPYGVSPIPLAAAAKEQIAGVQASFVIDSRNLVVSDGKNSHWERVTFTEQDFFNWLNFPLIAGQAELTTPNSVLITEKLALKYFGAADPIGKTLIFNPAEEHRKELTVAGVLKDAPLNSSIQFDLLTHINNQYNRDGKNVSMQDWSYLTDATFLVLKTAETQSAVRLFLSDYVPVQNQAKPEWEAENFSLEPLQGMAHHAHELRWDAMEKCLPPSMIWGTITMAILLLLTACLNFTNMTIGMVGKRLKEMGVRKVMGGTRQQLISQILAEGFLMSLGGLGIGLLLVDLLLPNYNQMWRFLELRLVFADNLQLVLFLLAAVFTTTFLAAAYPAFYITAFSPSHIFRRSVQFAGSNLFSRLLLGAQLIISTLAVVAGISFAQNAGFQQNADLGFEREGIQAIFTPNEQSYLVMEQMVRQLPQVTAAAGVHSHIGDSAPRVEFKLREKTQEAEIMRVGENYMETMNIRLQQGRSFNYELPSDYVQTILVNEKFVADFYPDADPIGQQITVFDSVIYTIAGVVDNFVQDNFFDPIRPLMLSLSKAGHFNYLVLKSSPDEMLAVRDFLERNWKSQFPEQPFEHYFQNDFLANSLEITTNIKRMFVAFSLITLFLTIAGLAALLSLDLLKRMREITIRRILGASSAHIAFLLSSNFLLVVGFSLVIGGAVGLWLSKMLLDNIYEIHNGVHFNAVAVAAVMVLTIVFVTIGSRIYKLLTGNLARTLQTD